MILPSLSIVPYAHNRAGNMFTQFPLDGGFTVSSSDQGTIVNADGIIERSPRNLCINTQNFTAGSWAQTGSPTVVNNAELAPDGTMTAALMTDGQIQYAAGIGVIGKQYTCSMYIRRIGGTGTVRFRAIENINTDIIVTSEWQRFSLTVAATTTTLRIGINLQSGTSTVAIWGAQIEESLTPTPYQRIDASRLNFPRIDWLGQSCPALLVEPAATNQIRNNSMVGAVSGGALPTNWSKQQAMGITQTVVGIGTENGVSYIDIRISGTQSDSTPTDIRFESATQIVASNGQTWSESVWLKIVEAPNPPINYSIYMFERTVAGGFIKSVSQVADATTTLTRFSFTRALDGGATVERVQPGLLFGMGNGSTYDFTIRIGYPQMEQSPSATSVIPTTTAAVTRAADVISASGALVSGLIGQTEGTIYAEVDAVSGINTSRLLSVTESGIPVNNRVVFNIAALHRLEVIVRSNNTNTAGSIGPSAATLLANGINKIAYAYNGVAGSYALAINGSVVATSAGTFAFTQALSLVNVARSEVDLTIATNQRIRAVALYTTRLDNYELMAMTSLDTSYEQLAARLSYAT